MEIDATESGVINTPTVDAVNGLLATFQRVIEYYSAVGDDKYDDYLKRMHEVLHNEKIQRLLGYVDEVQKEGSDEDGAAVPSSPPPAIVDTPRPMEAAVSESTEERLTQGDDLHTAELPVEPQPLLTVDVPIFQPAIPEPDQPTQPVADPEPTVFPESPQSTEPEAVFSTGKSESPLFVESKVLIVSEPEKPSESLPQPADPVPVQALPLPIAAEPSQEPATASSLRPESNPSPD